MRYKLNNYQKEVKETKLDQIILRWGRRTGKDFLIEKISGENDVVMYPNMRMAQVLHRGLKVTGRTSSGSTCITDPRQLLGFKIDKLFIVEPAMHNDLYEVLHEARKAQPNKIYLIGTPMPSEKILSSAFLFNAITREAEALKSDKIFFSLVGASEAPHIDIEAIKSWEQSMPGDVWITEVDADFLPKDNHV